MLTAKKTHCRARVSRTSNNSRLWTLETILCSTLTTSWAETFPFHKISSTFQVWMPSVRAIHDSQDMPSTDPVKDIMLHW